MAKWTVGKGLTDYIALLGDLEFKTPVIIGLSIYEGAKIVADHIRENIEEMDVAPDKSTKEGRRLPIRAERDGMLAGLGIAKMQQDGGFYNVKIGMDGYNSDVTAKYPKGKPNALIARSIESGTTFMQKNPFISDAVRKSRKRAEAAMRDECDKQIRIAMKEG